MTRTKGYHVRIWRAGLDRSAEKTPEDADYLREAGEPKLFVTQRAAREAADAYTSDKPDLTFALEPVVS